jgi:GDP-4-dehydro-6-deoxy-D-mannose reductase
VFQSAFRILITGGDGFVGPYLVRQLSTLPCKPDIVVGKINASAFQSEEGVRSVEFDVTDMTQVRRVITDERPTHLFHLAAISSVTAAQIDMRRTWDVNFGGTLNVAIGLTELAPECRLLYCSSSEIYGGSFRSSDPLDEKSLLDPVNPYGASKAAADIMIGQMAKQGLRAVRLRPFNHTGPGQSEAFVVPALARQISRIERGEQEPVIQVGNLNSRRDFLDVGDVVEAYGRAMMRFDDLPRGCSINIASGDAISINDILKILISMSDSKVEIRQNENLVRQNDIPVMTGNANLARLLLDWSPRINLSSTLASILRSYRAS